jgi:hypothetical protein
MMAVNVNHQLSFFYCNTQNHHYNYENTSRYVLKLKQQYMHALYRLEHPKSARQLAENAYLSLVTPE